MLSDLIQKRQSSRSYLSTPVPRETIQKCLEAARLAPSACNSQPWHFIVVDEPEIEGQLCNKIFSGSYAMNAFAKQAPVIIVVVSQESTFVARVGGILRGTRYYLIDIGIAVEHLILQATELGLSSCWIGWFNESEAKKVLHIPRNKKVDCVIPLGYTQESIRPKERKPLEEICSFNKY